jgi:hypothetical protein
MKYFLFLLWSFILFSCSNKHETTLELKFTSKNNNTIADLKSFYLYNIDASKVGYKRNQSFKNVKCVSPNKFLLNGVKTGLYIALMQIEDKSGTYNITIDSVLIKPGENHLTKEINLGSVTL